ncbi:flightin [Atheta coriaria]|uniref:flightin n=1 Tax=Dalotia coriaria TaxID=877792 RepID=UPI0031F477BE
MSDDDFFFGGDEDDLPPPAPEPGELLRKLSSISQASAAAAIAAAAIAGLEGGEPPAEGGEGEAAAAPQESEFETEYLDPDRLLLCRHWIRPKFLQYKYLFDYRQNYYDDVIDYLDKRQKGQKREIPRPQTWAERALRTYSNKSNRSDFYKSLDDDKKLAARMKLTGAFYHYHSREYFNRKYSSIL